MNIRDRRREVKARIAALRASGHTKVEVRRLAGVSERMVYFWYRGERTSQKVAAAHAALTNGVVIREGPHIEDGRPERATASRTA